MFRSPREGVRSSIHTKGQGNVWTSLALTGVVLVARYLAQSPDKKRQISSTPELARDLDDRDRHYTDNSRSNVPSVDWKNVALRTYKQVAEDRLLAVAAGVVFYGLLALFPAVTALVSSYALFADASTVAEHLAALSTLLPSGTFSIIQEQIERIIEKGNLKLGTAFFFSATIAVWSANGGMKAVIDALNVVYNEQEKRGFLKLNAVSLGFTLGGLLAVLAAIGLVVAAPIVLSTFGQSLGGTAVLQFGRWPALAVMIFGALATLYRFGPSRRSPQWQWISPGSIFATVTWIIGSALLSYYLANYGDYDATYGTLGAAIGLMMWMWMSTIVVLVGAELNSEIERTAKVPDGEFSSVEPSIEAKTADTSITKERAIERPATIVSGAVLFRSVRNGSVGHRLAWLTGGEYARIMLARKRRCAGRYRAGSRDSASARCDHKNHCVRHMWLRSAFARWISANDGER